MFKAGETIKTNTGEEVRILQLLSDKKGSSVYKVCIDQDIYVMEWFDKELYQGHFKIVNRLCDEKWSKMFVSPISLLQVQTEDSNEFGYIEPFISDEYCEAIDFFRSSDDMYAARFTTYHAMLQACLNISAAVQEILLKGYSFRDGVNPDHFKIRPSTGDIYVIGVDGIYECGSSNKMVQYSAPESIETNQSSVDSDYFSLAILLYRLIFIDHPFDGALWEKVPIITRDVERIFYGQKAVFHLDPDNESNRPTDIFAPNVINRWKVMPLELRLSFIRVFTDGIRNPKKRLSAGMWINTIARCRDKLIRLNAEREQFVNFDDARSVPPHCLGVKISGHIVALYPQKVIYQISVEGNHHQYGKIMAGITYNKQLDSLMIRNMTNTTWRGWSPKTKQLSVIPGGKEFPIFPGVLIEFQKENPRVVGEIFDAKIMSNN